MYKHKEAFCLMWYACKCGHRERYWNSRDGVTPYGDRCPSCGNLTLFHVDFQKDLHSPNHKPFLGQRVWIDMTQARASEIANRQIESYKKLGQIIPDDYKSVVTESIYHGGESPDCIIWGFK